MNKFYIKFLLLSLTFIGCTPLPPHAKAGNTIIAKFAKQSKQTQNLYLVGSGGAFYTNIKQFNFIFHSLEQVNINQAREMMVYNVENLLKMINNEPELQQFLDTRPFDQNNLKIVISFPEDSLYPDLVAFMFLSQGKVTYCLYDYTTHAYKVLLDEPYEESLRIVQEQNM